MSSSSSILLLTPIKKESMTTIKLTPPPPPSPTTKLVQFPPLPNLVDIQDEDYSNGRPIGFFLVAPAIGSSSIAEETEAIPTRSNSRKRVAVCSPPSSPKRRKLYPRPLKQMKIFSLE
mmetsp:Transcript_11804/g.18124  ORF Transcript_11804/g.18124 Transcript_11804/m.18124 type:complete len:118 (-) Transcript_11804:117-470(-)|eukprot:CAMPEP_0201727834 /NCGR_PEP_ID=MMETSP0593-20130828/13819_1 /ASSEMBLY_ACC=CAM_ASM_000672 /TAXON_ID=267983 /ORGANISM="Skeletonema japonicum, Strain CCMP2506" /LENGTH=117 /DNA_ID=CAMNT_0048219763 /DNA_START=125 /DNA_END=478 /DNA_ORIENTATION=-